MKVRDLLSALSDVANVDRRWSTDEGRTDLKELQATLEPINELTITELRELIQSANTKKKKPARSKAVKSSVPSINELGVARYFDELMGARDDNVVFDAIVKRAGKDRTIKVADASLLAQRFLGGEGSFKSKPKALKAILDRQIADRRAQSRGPKISGIF